LSLGARRPFRRYNRETFRRDIVLSQCDHRRARGGTPHIRAPGRRRQPWRRGDATCCRPAPATGQICGPRTRCMTAATS
jgi:hypothetical protein